MRVYSCALSSNVVAAMASNTNDEPMAKAQGVRTADDTVKVIAVTALTVDEGAAMVSTAR